MITFNKNKSENNMINCNKKNRNISKLKSNKLVGLSLILGVTCACMIITGIHYLLLPSLSSLGKNQERGRNARVFNNGDGTFDLVYHHHHVSALTNRNEDSQMTNTPQFRKHSIREGLDLFTAQSESDLYRLGSSLQESSPFCVPWNISSDDWWASEHGMEWNVFHEDDSHYCFEKFQDLNKRQFFRSIYQRQFLKDADQCRTMHVKKMWSSGFGADLSNVVDGLIHGALTGSPFQLARSTWHYACLKPCRSIKKAVCPTADLFCYFLPLSNCPRIKARPGVLLVKNTTSVNDHDDDDNSTASTMRMTPIKVEIKDGHYQTTECFTNNDPVKLFTQTPFTWYLEYVMRPQTWLRKMVHDLVAQYTIQTPCTVMHVRRGDVVLHNNWSRRYHAIEEYLNVSSIKNANHRYLIEDNILLLTDDHNAIGEATIQFPNKHWMYINRTRYRAHEGGWEQHLPSRNASFEMAVLMAEFQLARQCNSLIRSSSGFGNILQGVILDTNESAWIAHVENVNPRAPLHSVENAATRNISKPYV